MSQIFGHYIPPPKEQDEYLHIGFSPASVPLKQRWRNNGLSADFLAEYLTSFYPIDEQSSENVQKHKELRASVSHIANELIENALKYYDHTSALPIHVQLHLQTHCLRIYVINSVSIENQVKFQNFIKKLLNNDPAVLYLKLVEAASLDAHLETSGLGLLGLMEDYQVILGWEFAHSEQTPQRVVLVTTMAQLNL